MIRARFDENKALVSILYVARQLIEKAPERKADLYKTLKIIYFADRMHLARYCRAMSGDHYVAMSNGPVPSKTYDMLKFVRNDGYYISTEDFLNKLKGGIQFFDHITIVPNQTPDLDELSESELECINESIDRYKNFTFTQLKNESHDLAFKASDQDDCMEFEKIAIAGGADDKRVEFVRNWVENDNFLARQ
ncbi:MAG: DUF4065 domain-containing protein [Desulfobacteraceae bacterium]|nr:MAG: DUF4065 domain-containing protein [Desulfobacteraceae bacterium]